MEKEISGAGLASGRGARRTSECVLNERRGREREASGTLGIRGTTSSEQGRPPKDLASRSGVDNLREEGERQRETGCTTRGGDEKGRTRAMVSFKEGSLCLARIEPAGARGGGEG